MLSPPRPAGPPYPTESGEVTPPRATVAPLGARGTRGAWAALRAPEGTAVIPTAWRTWRRLYAIGLLGADVAAAALALVCTYAIRPTTAGNLLTVLHWTMPYREVGGFVLLAWLVALALDGAYRPHDGTSGFRDYQIAVVSALRLMAIVAVVAFALRAPLSRALVVAYFPLLMGWSLLTRWSARKLHGTLRARAGGVNRLVVAGDAAAVRKFSERLAHSAGHGFFVAAWCITEGPGECEDALVRGGPDDVVAVAEALGADSVAIVGHPSFSATSLQQVAWQLERSAIDLLVAPDMVDLAGPRIRFAPITGLPLLHVDEARIGGHRRWVKTAFERAVALPLTLLALPLIGALALVVLVRSGRPVFYRQRRVGLAGREFDMLKFRTMVPDADQRLAALLAENEHDGALFKIRDDPRVTPIGRVLRRHSLDELPQLFNVLKGDMVLVGPRPCLPREVEQFNEAARRRFLARPGMTGLWQVSGRSDLPWEEAVRLDLYYVENWSPVLDLMILYRTLRVVLRGTGY